ncbi:MAG: elongation factor P maturation arginine rhamnosyltransferase EarP, partial [Methyloversatilis sp.]|nr:elongation factor P maturation arginine rhamnosyltransferase EarP [Methyloversatilis sp.]
RAQWAARPLLWHIYPQDGGAHLRKLDAFLERHAEGLAADAAAHLHALHHGWNSATAVLVDGWQAVLGDLPRLAAHARQWAAALAAQDDLATQLVMFNQPPI